MPVTRRELIAAATAIGIASRVPFALAQQSVPYALGFTSLTDETHVPGLAVDGRLPAWLRGTLLRNGPALFEVGDRSFNHWFDGLAMLHAFSFSGGKVDYANRFLRSSAYDAWQQEGVIKYSEFATDPCRSVFAGVASIPILAPIPNANVSIERLAAGFVAHTEIPLPVRFDRRTLATLGIEDQAPVGQMGTAHPHHDARTGDRFRFETGLVGKTGYRVVRERGGRRTELAFVKRAEPGYMHSFALTARHVVLFEQPFVVDPASFLSPERKPIIENFRWEGARPARIVVIDRHRGGVVATVETDPFFVFHHINAFERGGRIHVDVCAHRDSRIIDALYLKRVRAADQRLPKVRARRIEIDLRARRAHLHDLAAADFELPRTDYERVNGRPYRYAYGIGMRDRRRSGFVDQIVKLDVRSGHAKTWHERGAYPGEPIFVRAPKARREDDGVLLSVVLDSAKRTSSLLVLDARSLEQIARADVPHHIPFGFHGLYAGR